MEFDKRDLDNHITGHYGEDQFPDEEDDCDCTGVPKTCPCVSCRWERDYGDAVEFGQPPPIVWMLLAIALGCFSWAISRAILHGR